MNHLVKVTKTDGTTELFEEEKLVNSLRRAGASAQAIDEVVEMVESEIRDGMTTSDLYKRAFALLHRHSAPIAAKYSMRRAMMEMGPDGFPFEKFVARIFAAWGYETMTDQVLMGSCVDHEVDVVAWKGNELSMVEAKYHNEYGMKSDLKVALYVKARFDDLSRTEFEFGGTKRKLSEGWLATNTKFTDKAIKYGTCSNLKLIGWNYPHAGNLHDIIEKEGLYPISSLTSLSRDAKRELSAQNILVVRDLLSRPEVLTSIGFKSPQLDRILEEARAITTEMVTIK